MSLPVIGSATTITADQFRSLMGKTNDGQLVLNKTDNGVSLDRVNRGNVFTRHNWKVQDVSGKDPETAQRNFETRSALFHALCSLKNIDITNVSDSDTKLQQILKDVGLDDEKTSTKPLTCREVETALTNAGMEVRGVRRNATVSVAGKYAGIDVTAVKLPDKTTLSDDQRIANLERQNEYISKSIEFIANRKHPELMNQTFEQVFPGFAEKLKDRLLDSEMLSSLKENDNKRNLIAQIEPLIKSYGESVAMLIANPFSANARAFLDSRFESEFGKRLDALKEQAEQARLQNLHSGTTSVYE